MVDTMRRTLLRFGLPLLLMAPARLSACKCEMTFSACAEAAQSEVVFIGTVESVEPSFLDHWNPAQRSSLAALNDEETAIMETGICTRTRRVSDAGEDLAYLYFLQHDKQHSARLEGFVTSNLLYQVEHDTQHYAGAIKSPVPNAVLEVRSAEGPRYTESDAGGRFVFDGLAAGVYNVTVFAPGYPREERILAGPRQVRVEPNACTTPIFVVP